MIGCFPTASLRDDPLGDQRHSEFIYPHIHPGQLKE